MENVERSIDITAGTQRVWDLVTRPGWWINDGEVRDHRIERDGDLARVTDPSCGEFEIHTVKLEPLSYAAFRWHSHGSPTLVEFWLDDHGDGTVTVRVVESGFGAAEHRGANDEGWRQELGALRRALA